MTDSGGWHNYRLFDRRLLSHLPLRLLRSTVPSSPSRASPDVLLGWSDRPVTPSGQLCAGRQQSRMHVLRDPQGWWAVLPSGGYAVRIHPGATQLNVYPIAGSRTDSAALVREPAAVVNVALSRLPSLWGEVPLHAACLATPGGVVLLAGASRSGKSTLSQHLQRDHGWVIWDDDVCLARISGTSARVVPMGGVSRLRADAAADLGVRGERLPGFRDGKVADVSAVESVAPQSWPGRLRAILHLAPEPVAGSAAVSIQVLRPGAAAAAAARAAAGLDREHNHWRRRVFEHGVALAGTPALRVGYARPGAAPAEVAAAIAQAVSRW